MDLKLVSTEPFVQFHAFRESLDRNLKVSLGALSLARQLPPNAESTAGNRLIQLPTEGEPWGKNTKWLNLDAVVADSLLFIAQMGLMQLFSAFEEFLIGAKAEFDRCEALLYRRQATQTPASGRASGLSKVCHAITLDYSHLDREVPIFEFFETMRNCLAHRRGRANEQLFELSISEELMRSIAAWPVRKGATLPALPLIVQGRPIPLLARHVIFAGIVCRSIANRVNEHLVSHLKEPGIVLMAANHALLVEEPVVRVNRRDAEAVVNEYLSGRYRVRMEGVHEAQRILKSLGQWDTCRSGFKKLYGLSK